MLVLVLVSVSVLVWVLVLVLVGWLFVCVDVLCVLCECVSVVALGSLVTSGGSHWGKTRIWCW